MSCQSTVNVRVLGYLLFGTPPSEADLVLITSVLGERLGNLENTSCSTTIVVDTWAFLDTVKMSTHHDNILRVTLLCLGDNVPGLSSLIERVHQQSDLERLATLNALPPSISDLLRNNANRDNELQVLSAECSTGDTLTRSVVDKENATSTSLLCELEFVRDGT
ncbi:hypothetical protein HG531_011263 [Fusarium graminearum]|nr:hypothetical protein HG531_011263 [Fusarium graminearum]